MELAKSGELERLVIYGKASYRECELAWEQIIRRANKANNSQDFANYVEAYRYYLQLIKDYDRIRAALIVLRIEVDDELITFLKGKGLIIDTSTGSTFLNSILLAEKRARAFETKIKMRQNDLALMTRSEGDTVETTFEEVLANVSVLIGFAVDPEIKLAGYNEYMKIIRKRSKQNGK
jgi:hypothetical protein